MPPRKKKVIDPADFKYEVVVDAAKGWSTEVLHCRLLGHSWTQDGNAQHYVKERYWIVGFFCERGCEVTKWEEWNERGLVVRKGMNYPQDEDGNPTYLLKGFGRVNTDERGALRLESVSRTKYVEIKEYPYGEYPSQVLRKAKENTKWPLN